jgi:DNA-binding LacI/PurR family transcriptional regulator
MADSLVSLFRATHSRLQGNDAVAVVAALLDKTTDDVLVRALAIIFYIARAKPTIAANDLLDLAIAQAADNEGIPGDGDAKLQAMADYLCPNLSTVAQPIPRMLLQYLGTSLVKAGVQPTRTKAVQHLLNTYLFA